MLLQPPPHGDYTLRVHVIQAADIVPIN
eukprot:SAG11_NODE_22054_length_413_cov_0.662420_1_plen_27_part_10